MADPRIIDVQLDGETLGARTVEVAQEQRVAIADLIAANHFAPVRSRGSDEGGPYRLALGCTEGRLTIRIAGEAGVPVTTLILLLGRFRRPIRDYFAICDSYDRAVRAATPQQIETIDMARRGIHNEGAELLRERLAGKIDVDFDTARRLFTLICSLHIRN